MEKSFELGSEFHLSVSELEKKQKNIYWYLKNHSTIFFDSGRSAIRFFLENVRQGKVLLPEFICESVIKCFDEKRMDFYHIDALFRIDLEDVVKKIDKDVSIIYICHYFGYLQEKSVLKRICQEAEKFGIIVLEDYTQSMFSDVPQMGNYMIGSIRKWFPIPHGGILYSLNHQDIERLNVDRLQGSKANERVNGMILKDLFLRGDFNTNMMYREIFRQEEEKLDKKTEIYGLSDFSKFILECFDVEKMIKKRKANALYLQNALDSFGIGYPRRYNESECPFAVPIRVHDRERFREYLISKNIYCAVHWPFYNIMAEQRLQAKKNADQLLSLPIDQRYEKEDLDYMIRVISEYGGDLTF